MAAVSRPLIDGCSYVRALAGASVVVVVLLAPSGQPAVHADLRLQDESPAGAHAPVVALARSGSPSTSNGDLPMLTSTSSVRTFTMALSLKVMYRE